ncbi:hypothetical protein ACN28E_25065 [Archangium lansingense]|uniref:hypothetical protein n=1 Tax=Archangium lansingense TaxID=2995310 RepID=UPI003B80F1E7
MKLFLTERHRRLFGLPEPEKPKSPYGPGNLSNVARCCDQAVADMCTCDWYWWRCPHPDHPDRGACHPTNTHD